MWGTDMCSSQKPFVCKSEFYDFVPDYRYIGVFRPSLNYSSSVKLTKNLGPFFHVMMDGSCTATTASR